MKLHATQDTLVLTRPSYISALAMGIGGLVMIALAIINIGVPNVSARWILAVLGVGLVLVAIFGSRHLRIEFSRPDGTVTLIAIPIIPIDIGFIRPHILVRDLSTFRFAYAERTLTGIRSDGGHEKKTFHIALAKDGLPDELLEAKRAPAMVTTDESVRWVISTHGPMPWDRALSLSHQINQWMGAASPPQYEP